MLVVISPAKRLDWDRGADLETTQPRFDREAARLAGHARQLNIKELRALMDISEDLARLNRDRFRDFAAEPDPRATRPAVLAFAGDTYTGLDAPSLDPEGLAWAQDHLRILSGLYGALRPLDAIQPYRLEMGSALRSRRGGTLYDFWRKDLARSLKEDARALGTDTLVNCASQEYFGAVDEKSLGLRVISPVFLERKDGKEKIVSFFAKKARGAMARFIIDQRVTDAEGVLDFDYGGYRHEAAMSDSDRPVFVRETPAEAG
ncbi:hypothetical protein BV394_09630 [Brevirhabdus pacifica]|uniref:UPF0246 protein BV394_09630 n=1 Tax=Brevirhabdus pacifica TaxID=1267768 RepID=A0A1U7DJ46_9RHOB|nr:peroxide stress protein YaaA [Brevirhabdus pacifica]APX89945.1 hypothetical protein BV394_09630 [Brevirhabdus pacifica]OWU74329.1 hypothetical protein ATO5_13995 [Loktanella sp. 22II-4b]PJJ82825.1 hypothetical protein CLV77_2600 [Brevirhabdus pacifica]